MYQHMFNKIKEYIYKEYLKLRISLNNAFVCHQSPWSLSNKIREIQNMLKAMY